MRVILKPVGLLCVLVAFAVVTWIAVLQSQKIQAGITAAQAGVVPAPKPSVVSSTLVNAGFETSFGPVIPYAATGKVSGKVAAPWADDSSWAPVTVEYSQDDQNPHEGKYCQKVVITDVAQKDASVQFVQEMNLALDTVYHASCWIRADRPTVIDIMLRQKASPYRSYGVNKVSIGTDWQKIEVSGTPNIPGTSIVMLKISKPVTFWVDDASLTK